MLVDLILLFLIFDLLLQPIFCLIIWLQLLLLNRHQQRLQALLVLRFLLVVAIVAHHHLVLLIIECLTLLRLRFVPLQYVLDFLTAYFLVAFKWLVLLLVWIGISEEIDKKMRKLKEMKTYRIKKHHSLVHYLKMRCHQFKFVLKLIK
jgi:hypothetical protein